jgi:hypothetical protein
MEIPEVVRGREPRAFQAWLLDAQELGFEMRVDHDLDEFTVWVMLKPRTRRAKTAVDRALDDDCELITAEHCYDMDRRALRRAGIASPPIEDVERVFAFAVDDAASYALTMAREALAGGVS